MVMEFSVNGTMVMIMNILFVFLMMFIGSLEGLPEYPNLKKPYNLHFQVYACPNCEAWCANLTDYTCNYNCHRLNIYHHKLSYLKEELSYKQYYAENDNNKIGQNVRREVHLDLWLQEDRKKLKEYCSEKETYNCIFENTNVYPLCALDFTPYDDNLKECCRILKKCTADNYPNAYDPECHPVYGEIWVDKDQIRKFPKENPKYWTLGIKYIAGYYKYRVIDACKLQCTNGRLVPNNRSQTTETPTIKTTFSTSISTTKLTTTKIPIPKTSPTPNLTAKIDKTEAISQVIVGFLGINFVVVGAAIVAVIADLF